MNNNKNRSGFGKAFYVANFMEIFERLAWYGFFTLSSLYMTSPVEQGGLAFNDSQRGALQGIVPFFLYLLPVLTGALADRYGYRRMFLVSFAIMAPSYYLLGQVDSFSGFFVTFMMVALGAACFKPVVVATVSHATNDDNRGLGFGIFYTMINVGGFIGPLIAGYVRAISWDAVFVMSSLWICVNFMPAVFLYRDPDCVKNNNIKFGLVLKQAQLVLGNGRFALLVFPCIFLLMAAGASWLSYSYAFLSIGVWVLINLVWDRLSREKSASWYKQPIQISNAPFLIYLLLITGFWAVYNQLFYTMPLFIRDFVDTGDLVELLGPSAVEFFAYVDVDALTNKLDSIIASGSALDANQIRQELVHYKVLVPVEVIDSALVLLQQNSSTEYVSEMAHHWAQTYRQVNPEYIINLDFAAIVLCQTMVSYVCQKFKTISVLMVGLVVFAIGLLISIWANSVLLGGSIAVLAVLMMAFGEMITSPKSQEYVASIAPKDQAALYMGYYFVSMALGFLFAGLLSGWGYGTLAKEMGRPDLMWGLFSLLALITSFGLFWFNQTFIKSAKTSSTQIDTNTPISDN